MNPSIPVTARRRPIRSPDAQTALRPAFLESPPFTAEMRLLLACCRLMTGSGEEGDLVECLAAPFDDAVFSGLCGQHRLSLVVHKMAIRPYRTRFSPELAAAFASGARDTAVFQLRLGKSMVEIHKAMAAGSIRHLFLKGPALNRLLYGEELLRQSRDVDVLIGPGDVLEADACLRRLGYRPVYPSREPRLHSRFFRMRYKDVTYARKGGPAIELHWMTDLVETIVKPGLFAWDSQLAYGRFGEESIPMLADYHHCLYLCLHAAKHHWARLQWLLDIPLLMRKRDLDRSLLLALADRHGLRNVVLEAFALCERLFHLDFGYARLDPSGKRARQAMRRNRLLRLSLSSPWHGRALYVCTGLLYPGVRPKLRYWLWWIADKTLHRMGTMANRLRTKFAAPVP